MKFTVLNVLAIFLLANGCKSVNDTAKTSAEETVNQTDWSPRGYLQGVIKKGETNEVPCDFLIEVDTFGLMEVDEFPKAFKSDGLSVWVKINPQRRMSNCGGTTPGELIDIKKRED
jgi:hypothetical protein